MHLHIGLDFDGVIGDSAALKETVAQNEYGTSYDALGDERREEVRQMAYADPEYALDMHPVPSTFQYLSQLAADGHEITIITSRDGNMLTNAQEWYADQCEQQPYDLPDVQFIGVGKDSPKDAACQENDVDVFVDDDPEKIPRSNEVTGYHFTGDVESWEELYNRISQL